MAEEGSPRSDNVSPVVTITNSNSSGSDPVSPLQSPAHLSPSLERQQLLPHQEAKSQPRQESQQPKPGPRSSLWEGYKQTWRNAWNSPYHWKFFLLLFAHLFVIGIALLLSAIPGGQVAGAAILGLSAKLFVTLAASLAGVAAVAVVAMAIQNTPATLPPVLDADAARAAILSEKAASMFSSSVFMGKINLLAEAQQLKSAVEGYSGYTEAQQSMISNDLASKGIQAYLPNIEEIKKIVTEKLISLNALPGANALNGHQQEAFNTIVAIIAMDIYRCEADLLQKMPNRGDVTTTKANFTSLINSFIVLASWNALNTLIISPAVQDFQNYKALNHSLYLLMKEQFDQKQPHPAAIEEKKTELIVS